MAHRANKRPPGRIKSSIVARLNTRLFFRLLDIYFTMDLLLLFLFCCGLLVNKMFYYFHPVPPVIYEKKILAMGRPTAKTAIRLIMLIRIPYL